MTKQQTAIVEVASKKPSPSKKRSKRKSTPRSAKLQLETDSAEYPKDDGFSIYDGYLWYQPPPKIRSKGEEQPQRPVKVCSELSIIARTRDSNGCNHGRLLAFRDADGQLKIIPIPCSELQGDGLEVRKRLADEGLYINPYKPARIYLVDYILNSETEQVTLCVERTGWYENLFILPKQTIGNNGSEQCLFQPKALNHKPGIAQKGELHQWQALSKLCINNSRLVFAVSSAFAAPLLSLVDDESGGFNLFGQSSTGKSTALKVACSVYGRPDYRQQWRATVNGLEAVCTAHNDCLLVLDEIGEMEPRDLGKCCYMVANGQGKARANESVRSQWRTLMLSSAENTLAQYISETGRPVKAGQSVRLIDIPADPGSGFGLFENLHGFNSGSEFSEALKEQAKQAYGLPIVDYLKALSQKVEQNRLGFLDTVHQFRQGFTGEFVHDKAAGQVMRGANRFALVAYAGELATELGITQWPKGEAKKSAVMCFQAWLNHRGGIGSQEEQAILQQVRYFFQRYFDSGFVSTTDADSNPPLRKGFKQFNPDGSPEFWVLSEIFKQEISANYDPKTVARYCINAGYLIPSKEGYSQQNRRIPIMHGNTKQPRKVYVFSDLVLGQPEKNAATPL